MVLSMKNEMTEMRPEAEKQLAAYQVAEENRLAEKQATEIAAAEAAAGPIPVGWKFASVIVSDLTKAERREGKRPAIVGWKAERQVSQGERFGVETLSKRGKNPATAGFVESFESMELSAKKLAVKAESAKRVQLTRTEQGYHRGSQDITEVYAEIAVDENGVEFARRQKFDGEWSGWKSI